MIPENDPAITRHARLRCPHCGHTLDAAGTTDGLPGTPEDGDPTCCIACGFPMVFHPDPLTGLLTLVPMTRAEADALTPDEREQLARVQWYAKHIYQPERHNRN